MANAHMTLWIKWAKNETREECVQFNDNGSNQFSKIFAHTKLLPDKYCKCNQSTLTHQVLEHQTNCSVHNRWKQHTKKNQLNCSKGGNIFIKLLRGGIWMTLSDNVLNSGLFILYNERNHFLLEDIYFISDLFQINSRVCNTSVKAWL